MTAHEITEAMFAPYKRNVEMFGQARLQGEKFVKLYAEQTRIMVEEAGKMQDRALEVAAHQTEVMQGYVEKTIELSLAAFKVPAA